jgi:DNA sulfur modification protein DndB
MSFIKEIEIEALKGKLTKDLSVLGRLYKAKKSSYMLKSVEHALVEGYIKDGWEESSLPLKTKTKIRKLKEHNKQFEDDLWCQLYDLGYRHLNYDETFELAFGKNPEEKKQIDVIAIDKETIIIVECKSSAKPRKAPSFKDEFELLSLRLNGFKKVLEQAFGKNFKIKYIFATRNLRIDVESIDLQRLKKTNSFYYSDNTYKYVSSLIKNYKNAASYQFLGLLFKNQLINSNKIEVPAIEGNMGNKKYYMFSIEPQLLLKMGFILHRTKANEEDMPTYQRLLVPSRLKGISKFINDGGYFPNSLIVNFNQKKHRLQFEPSSRSGDTSSRFGMLKIPNAYAVAYVIDGQHRLYGYANSNFKDTNTVPVVAFKDLLAKEQLEIFMDINQNQKAVSPSLRLTLEEDLFWDSDRVDSRIKALRSSIIKDLSESQNNVLYNKISIGEDSALLTFKPFYNALKDSGLLPNAKGNKYIEESVKACLYDIKNQEHEKEMLKAKKKVIQLLNFCYEFVENNYPSIYEREKYFILSNRGTYAFITLIGSLNSFLTHTGNIDLKSKSKERFDEMKKYLACLLNYLKSIPKEEEEKQLTLLGSGADVKWLRFFQSIVNSKFKNYEPIELIEWKERNDQQLQEEGRKYGVTIEKHFKKIVLSNIKTLFKENWELEINSVKRECQDRAEKEMEKFYKEFKKKKEVHWTEMFGINDYKTIIEKYWTSTPEEETNKFRTFQDIFSIDMGSGFNSKKERTKWISLFNSHRNAWAHEGTKEKGLNKEEVKFLKMVHNHFEKMPILN